MPQTEDEPNEDWEIDTNGLWVATRPFLIRRGYCCANQCRNCPYIDWRHNPTWQPGPTDAVQFAEVSPKALQGIHQQLTYHKQQLQTGETTNIEQHQAMITHYTVLLERWES